MAQYINPDRVVNPLIQIFSWFGAWHTDVGKTRGYLFIIFWIMLVVSMMVFLLLLDDSSKLAYALWMLLTESCGCLKFWFNITYHEQTKQLIERIRRFRLRDNTERAIAEKHYLFLYKIGVPFCFCAMSSVLVNEITAALYEEPFLPFSCWFPYLKWKENERDYWIAWVYEFIAINTTVLLMFAMEMLSSFFLFAISIEIEIIGKRLKDFGKSTVDPAVFLIECVRLHLRTMEFRRLTLNFMNLPYFCQLCASGIVISAIVADLAMGRGEIYSYTSGAAALTLQLFLVCYFASRVMEQSELMALRLYKSNWPTLMANPENREKYKPLILILMECTQPETEFVGYIFPLSLKTFTSVMNFAFSVFALLKRQSS